jgi:hypothetical protein
VAVRPFDRAQEVPARRNCDVDFSPELLGDAPDRGLVRRARHCQQGPVLDERDRQRRIHPRVVLREEPRRGGIDRRVPEVDEREAHLRGEQACQLALAQCLAGEDVVGEPFGGSVGPAQLRADEDELGADGVEGVHGGSAYRSAWSPLHSTPGDAYGAHL